MRARGFPSGLLSSVPPTLPNINLCWQVAQPNDGENECPGRAKMSALQDREMERLSDLLAQGALGNAREIARLLRVEIGGRRNRIHKDGSLRLYLRRFGRIANPVRLGLTAASRGK